jgi:hypothetical protein
MRWLALKPSSGCHFLKFYFLICVSSLMMASMQAKICGRIPDIIISIKIHIPVFGGYYFLILTADLQIILKLSLLA